MFLSKPEDLEDVLVTTQLEGLPITITIKGIEKTFAASILEVCSDVDPDVNMSSILVTGLEPEEGNEIIAFCNLINVSFTVRQNRTAEASLTYNFNAVFVRAEQFNQKPALRISYPERRRYLRVEPLPQQPVVLTIYHQTHQTVGRLFNISEGGVGFYINREEAVVSKGKRLQISFALPGSTSEITTSAVVRWVVNQNPPKHWQETAYRYFCGAEFSDMAPAARDAIKTYVSVREEQEIKKLMSDKQDWDSM